MMLIVKFATVQGKFAVLPAEFRYKTRSAALAAVKAFAEAAGYSNVREVLDADSIRYTARTPNGRSGRNVAFAHFDSE
jgi:predicted AAA+ superfamily ATPase